MSNPYYKPEDLELRVVDTLDRSAFYDFDMLIVWQHKDGRLFYAQDSGCSCPIPFEEFLTLEDLNEILPWTYSSFCKDVEIFCKNNNRYSLKAEKTNLLSKVHHLLQQHREESKIHLL